MKLNITYIIVLICIGFAHAQTIDLNQSGSLPMQELNEQQRQSLPNFESVKRIRPFNLNSQITNHQNIGIGNQINLSLFQDIIHPATVVRKASDINGVVTLTLKLNAFKYSYAYIAISPDSYLITVDLPEENQKYSSRSAVNESQSYMLQLDETEFQNAGCGLDDVESLIGRSTGIISPGQDDINRLPTDSNRSPADINLDGSCIDVPYVNDPATITIMIVYTSEAQNWSDSNNGGIANSIATTMALANQVSVNNNLGITFQLVYSGLVDYTQDGFFNDYINLLTDGDGILDEVNQLRQDNNADLVALFNYYQSAPAAGVANLLDSKYGNNRAVFSATRVNFVANSNTFIHEIGHNLGAMHNPYQASDPGPTEWENWPENTYSAGWRWQGSDGNYYADLMSYQSGSEYENGISTSHIPYFSDPNHTHLGGVAGDPVLGDNARTLRETKHFVARYKETIDYCNAGNAPLFGQTALYIDNVSMGVINNGSGASSVRYGDFTALATCMIPGDTQTLNISVVNSFSGRPVKVWIDWNDDKVFDPETELIYDSVTGSANHSINVTAPLGVSYGTKRLRIRTYSLTTEPVIDGPCGYSGIGEVEDYTINLEAPVACTEAVIPQNLLVGTLTSSTANISWDTIEGIDHYELRYREIGASEWETLSPIWYPYHTISNLIFETEYEAQVRSVCSSTPGSYSPSINFTTIGYCAAGSNDTIYEKISNVTFNDINNNSTSTAGYEDFTSISTDVEQGNSYAFSASFTGQSYSSDQVLVWVDFNQDGDFSDAGEQVLVTATSMSPWQGTINIPSDAPLGETRMRIRLHDTGASPNATPCGNSGFGQVEDYTLNIITPVVCDEALTPLNLAVSNVTNDEATLTWDAVPGTTYDVRYREIGVSEWIDVSNLSQNTVIIGSLMAATSYEAQVRSICNSVSGNYTSSVNFNTLSYCTSSGDSNINIVNVTFGDINQSSPGGATVSSYTDFTNVFTIVERGQTYAISITAPGPPIGKNFRVWIDYNLNGSFDDSGELVLDVPNTLEETVVGNITPLEGATLGSTRMRVSVKMYSPPQGSCDIFAFGEVEDYTVMIKDSTLSQDAVDFGNDFKIYPNPINDVFYILTQNIQGDDVDITVTNMAGQKVYNSTMKVLSNGSLSVQVPGLSSGMYLVNLVHSNGGKFTSKLIKQ